MLHGVEGLCDNSRKTSQCPKTATGAESYKTFPAFFVVVIYEGMQQSVQANVKRFFFFNNWYSGKKKFCRFDRIIQLIDFHKSCEKRDKRVNIQKRNSR